ncbi:hypothetical protein D9611_004590 [Ephemerocybe angulata]|uniref:Rab-GAP TBC domain-containing protein n=1 Tax=Ephemerocybe angulata TaxID=980116 RepID=A0A8H5BLG6_9AGAR|nr:hypothetical protein D9611_004590 [Tulosesus angulatus]
MTALPWEPTSLKAHLRYTTQRLGQLQGKLDNVGNITRKDIATLLQQGNVGLARAKAQKLIQEDAHGDLLEILEMEVALLLEHFNEMDTNLEPTPLLSEAIASIIYAGPHAHCKGRVEIRSVGPKDADRICFVELDAVRSTLIQRFGPDFARAATTNRENYVPIRVLRILNAPLPSATLLNRYLATVARSYGVNWLPDPERHDIVNVLSEVLNSEISAEVDLDRLRKYCVYGTRLFFGILPAKQSEWSSEITKQRDCYYDLVKRLLKPYEGFEEKEEPEAEALDEALLNIFKHISRIPREMFSHLAEAPETFEETPVSASANPDVKIDHAFALDHRLKTLRENDTDSQADTSAPEITISIDNEPTPGISLTDFDEDDDDDSDDDDDDESDSDGGEVKKGTSKTIIEKRIYSFGNAHPVHCSAILRLLFIHASINPGKLSPHVPALLVPFTEVEPEDLAHVEADTFWLFEAIVSEFSELDEEEGGQKWMASFDSVVAWADPELHENLQIKGLQPALPHYSYRWLAPLLTYTIPVPGIFLIWDAIFARLPRERDTNYKLDFLVDVTSAMLISVRRQLLSLGQTSSSNLWNDEGLAPELVAREVSADDNTFLDGISLLQAYPLTSIQDAERIVQTANDLNNRREMEKRAAEVAQAQPTFGARLATSMWKGFTNQPDPADDSPPSDSDRDKRDDGNETERPAQASTFNLTSVLGGLRPKPQAPVPAPDATTAAPSQPIGASAAAGFWNYAGKLKDSDTVATLAKVGTNWRAKAATVGSQWGRNSISVSNNGQSSSISQRLSGGSDHRPEFGTGDRRDTFVTDARRDSSPRPYFTSPTFQDTAPGYYSSSSNTSSSITSSPTSPADSHHNDSIVKKTKTLLSIASKSPTTVISKRSPRPLLLNSAAPMTSPPAHIRSGSDRLKTPDSSEWAEVVKMKRDYMHRHSQSSHSVSSLSPSDAIKSNRSDWDSDTGSRVVPLNRRSVSPMAPSYRINSRPSSSYTPTKSPMSPPGGNLTRLAPQRTLSPQPGLSDEPQLGDTMKQAPESLMGRSSEVPKENHGEEPGPHKQFIAARTGTLEETSDSSWQPNQISRAPRVRSKKYPQRPANLQIRDSAYPKGRTSIEQKTPSPSRLTVDWPTEDPEVTVTPRASSFEPAKDESTPMRSVSPRLRRTTSRDRQRKASADGLDGPPRKLSSASVRSRKVSAGEDSKRYRRESAAHEGDDEGYDDLLSAYESEDDPRPVYP